MVSDCLNRDNPLNPPYQGDRICRIGEVVRSGISTGIFMILVISRIGGLSEAGFTGFVGFSGLASGVGNQSSLLQDPKLLLNQHFSGCVELACGECVEIEPGGDLLADLVPAVPVCCASSTSIEPRRLMP